MYVKYGNSCPYFGYILSLNKFYVKILERNFHKKSVFVQKIYEFPTKFVFIREYVDMNYHILRTFLSVFFYAFLLRFNIKTAEKI